PPGRRLHAACRPARGGSAGGPRWPARAARTPPGPRGRRTRAPRRTQASSRRGIRRPRRPRPRPRRPEPRRPALGRPAEVQLGAGLEPEAPLGELLVLFGPEHRARVVLVLIEAHPHRAVHLPAERVGAAERGIDAIVVDLAAHPVLAGDRGAALALV